MTVSEWMEQYSDLYDEDAEFHVFGPSETCGHPYSEDSEMTPEGGIEAATVKKQYGDWQVVDRDVSVRTDVALYIVPASVKLPDDDDKLLREQEDELLRDRYDDPVNHPSHYTRGGIECIDAIKASMSAEAFHGFLQGNAMKYIWRHSFKGKPVEDLDKAMWYLTRLRNEIKP